MNLNRRQKQFVATISVATIVTICSHVNVLGLALQPYPKSPDSTQVVLVTNNKQAGATTEEIGRNCLPEGESTGAELVGEYQNSTSTQLFQVWKLNLTSQHSVLRIHGLYGTTCLPAYDERYNDTIADDLSQDDAQQVALVVWKHRADEIGGLDALQTNFNNQAAELEQYGETEYLPAEDLWALEELGIQIPNVYEVYDPENPPQRTRPSRGEI